MSIFSSSVSLQTLCIQLVIILGFFFFFLDTRKSFSCQLCVWSVSAWLLTPIFLRFKLCVCIYIDCCLLPEMYVCTCLPTPFSAGELELPWRPTNQQCFKGNIFHYVFVSSFFFFPGGLCFQFCLVWELNHPTLLLRTAFGFLTAAITKSV